VFSNGVKVSGSGEHIDTPTLTGFIVTYSGFNGPLNSPLSRSFPTPPTGDADSVVILGTYASSLQWSFSGMLGGVVVHPTQQNVCRYYEDVAAGGVFLQFTEGWRCTATPVTGGYQLEVGTTIASWPYTWGYVPVCAVGGSASDTRSLLVTTVPFQEAWVTGGTFTITPTGEGLMPTYVWTVCDDGKLYKTDGSTILQTVDIDASEPWLTATNLLMVAPGPAGSIVVLDGNGVEKQRRWVLPRVAWATGLNGRVYCFDGAGQARVVDVAANGTITPKEPFTARGVVNPLNSVIVGTTLYVACENRDVVQSFNLTNPDAPVQLTPVRYLGSGLTSVIDATTVTKKIDNAAALGGDTTLSLFGGIAIGASKYFLGNGAVIEVT
jgi:hypothetical protein